MKCTLNKRLKRDLRHNLGKYLGLFLLMALTVAMVSGFLIAIQSILDINQDTMKSNKVEDGQFIVNYELTDDALKAVNELELDVYENFYADLKVSDVSEEADGDEVRIYNLDSRKQVDIPSVYDGSLPETKEEIALDRLYAESNGIALGNTVVIGGEEYQVVGTVALPDYVALFKSNSDFLYDSLSFGVGVVTDEAFDTISENQYVYEYVWRYQKSNLDNEDKNDLVEELQETLQVNGASLTSVIRQEDNQAITYVQNDSGSDIPMVQMMMVMLILIIGFIYAVMINHTIERESAVIGTLLASGFTRGQLLRYYMTMPMILTIAALIFGNIMGYTVETDSMKATYYGSLSLPVFEARFNLGALIFTTIIPLMLITVILFVSLHTKLKIKPLDLLRHNVGVHKKKKATKLPDISFHKRFLLRILMSHKWNYAILFVGIIFSSLLLMFGLGMAPMIENYEETIKDTYVCDYQYLLKMPVEIEEEGAEKVTISTMETYYDLGGENIELTMYGLEEDGEYFTSVDVCDYRDGVVITEGLLNKLGLEVGDELTLVNSYTNDETTVTIKDTIYYTASLSVFMSRSSLNELAGGKVLGYEHYDNYDEETFFNGYLCDHELDIEKEDIAKKITLDDVMGMTEQINQSMASTFTMFEAFAIIISIVLMYLLTKMVIEASAKSISLLKIFGYSPKRIRRLYLNTTTITVVAALVIGLPIEAFVLSKMCVWAFSSMSGYVEFYIAPSIYAMVVLIGLVSYFVINFFHMRRINRISMQQVLKVTE